VERFGQLHGTGRASNNPAKIEDVARHGRVEPFRRCELLDRVAVDTLRLQLPPLHLFRPSSEAAGCQASRLRAAARKS
jgi:hypothetical protein